MLVRAPAAAFAALLLTAAATAEAASRPEIRHYQQVSSRSPFTAACGDAAGPFRDVATEPSLAVLPRTPRVQVMAWIQDTANGIVTAHTRDGGQSWQQVVAPGLSTCSGSSLGYTAGYDPWLSAGPDGTVYLAAGSNSPATGLPAPAKHNPFDGSVMVDVSGTGGASWSGPYLVARDQDNAMSIDKPTVTADPTRPGVVYASWTRIVGLGMSALLEFASSSDHGHSWSAAQPVAITTPGDVEAAGQVLALPDGTLVVTATQGMSQPLAVGGIFLGNSTVIAYRSTDHGASWQGPLTLGNADGFPALASSASGPDGTLAVAWLSGGALQVAHSRDGGASWTAHVAVPAAVKPFLQTVSVGPAGTLALLYNAPTGPSGGSFARAALALSRDGVQWHSMALGQPFDMSTAPATNGAGGRPLGDYEGIAESGSGFALAFIQDAPVATQGTSEVFYAALHTLPAVR